MAFKHTPQPIRFGRFRVDLTTHRLTRDGARVSLQEKQFRLLLALLARPNAVVERSELHHALWPDSDYGEFDVGLNQAVRRLRRALDDSAQDPTWIETIPTVGYRFIGRIQPETKRFQPLIWVAAAAALAITAALLWRLPAPASAAFDPAGMREVVLTSRQGHEVAPRFSPDGTRIAYAHRQRGASSWHIYVETIGALRPLQLTHGEDENLAPAWSPDGESIAFLRRASRMEPATLFVTPADGGPIRKLAELECRDSGGMRLDWSDDGRAIAFAGRSDPKGPMRIGLLDVETVAIRWLTAPAAGLVGDAQPIFSGDESQLAFVRRRGYTSGWNVFVLDLDKDLSPRGEPRSVTPFDRMATAPDWSLDGRRLLFLGEKAPGQEGVWQTSPDGRGEPELVWRSSGALLESTFGDSALSVGQSPSGGFMMAFTRGAPRDLDIYRTPLAGPGKGQAAKLISTSFPDTAAKYSPDGKQIAFYSGAPTSDLWLADTEGNVLRRLTHLESRITGAPVWSPDGSEIVFHSRHAGPANVYTVTVATGEVRALVESPSDDAVPSWSGDGRWVYFLSSRDGGWSVWRLPSAGGEAHKLLDAWAPTLTEAVHGESLLFNESRSGDLFEAPLDNPGKPRLLRPGLSKEVAAFQVSRSGVFFVDRGDDPAERSSRRVTTKGMLCRLNPENGKSEELFEVLGYLSSVAPDESAVLTVHGPHSEVDLRILLEPGDTRFAKISSLVSLPTADSP